MKWVVEVFYGPQNPGISVNYSENKLRQKYLVEKFNLNFLQHN